MGIGQSNLGLGQQATSQGMGKELWNDCNSVVLLSATGGLSLVSGLNLGSGLGGLGGTSGGLGGTSGGLGTSSKLIGGLNLASTQKRESRTT